MYDPDTAALIRATPELDGLDRQALPDLLTKTFAQIAAARIRLRGSDDEEPDELAELIEEMRRLAYTNEALVSALPEREDRSAAAFVAATAHQLCFNADRLFDSDPKKTFVGIQSVSSDIAAMLLFMVAEATADASEVSKALAWETSDAIEAALIASLQDFARGNLLALTDRAIPDRQAVASENSARSATRALYLTILEGVHVLASRVMLGNSTVDERDPVQMFRRVRALSIGPEESVSEGGDHAGQRLFRPPSPSVSPSRCLKRSFRKRGNKDFCSIGY